MSVQDFQQALDQAFATIHRTIPVMGTDRPCRGRPDLTYERCDDKNWVDGFWSGQLWLAYAETQDDFFFQAARQQRPYFLERLERPDSHDHDLGFLYSLSAVADFKLTGDEEARQMGLAAAESLASRYNPAGRFIRAWNPWYAADGSLIVENAGRIIIDCAENLGLLFWAAQESGNTRYAEIATAHAHTSVKNLVRPDGSTYHSFHFDPQSGAPLRGETVQGYANESCWSRGQAWGIHGYAVAYAYTGVPLFLETARQLADFAIANLPDDGVPLWDYRLPAGEHPYRDTSAAAIMAAGLFVLADNDVGNGAAEYRAVAQRTLHSLYAHYSTAGHPTAEGLLREGASFVRAGHADNMLPYGDYFYVEALLRALGRKDFFW